MVSLGEPVQRGIPCRGMDEFAKLILKHPGVNVAKVLTRIDGRKVRFFVCLQGTKVPLMCDDKWEPVDEAWLYSKLEEAFRWFIVDLYRVPEEDFRRILEEHEACKLSRPIVLSGEGQEVEVVDKGGSEEEGGDVERVIDYVKGLVRVKNVQDDRARVALREALEGVAEELKQFGEFKYVEVSVEERQIMGMMMRTLFVEVVGFEGDKRKAQKFLRKRLREIASELGKRAGTRCNVGRVKL